VGIIVVVGEEIVVIVVLIPLAVYQIGDHKVWNSFLAGKKRIFLKNGLTIHIAEIVKNKGCSFRACA